MYIYKTNVQNSVYNSTVCVNYTHTHKWHKKIWKDKYQNANDADFWQLRLQDPAVFLHSLLYFSFFYNDYMILL